MYLALKVVFDVYLHSRRLVISVLSRGSAWSSRTNGFATYSQPTEISRRLFLNFLFKQALPQETRNECVTFPSVSVIIINLRVLKKLVIHEQTRSI